MKVYVCDICGYRYDESKEKVLWEDLPEDWVCPLCGVGKDRFTLLKDSTSTESAEGGADPGPIRPQLVVSDILAETLVNWGVRWVFGMLGHSNLGLGEAIRKKEAGGGLRFISIRHEGAASFACSAYGKLTRHLSACLSIAGPGATNLLTGLWDANLDRSPVLAITGQVETQVLGPGGFQEVDLQAAYGKVASWQQTVLSSSHYGELMSLACKNALTNRRVAHLVVPDEIQKQPVLESEQPGDPAGRMMETDISPSAESVRLALELLRNSSKPVVIAGYGAIPAAQIVVRLAETLNCPLITTYKSKGMVPDRHPLACGVVGRSGTPVAARFMIESDCLVVLGAGFSDHSGISRNKPAIQVDFDPSALARFSPVTVPVWGDIGKTVELMLGSLCGCDMFEDRRPDIASEWEAWRREKKKRSGVNSRVGLSSAAVYEVLGRVAPGDALIAIDVGDNAYSFGRYFESQSQPVIMSGYLGSIGFSFPAAMGAWAASQEQDSEYQGRKVISISGDGGFAQYMGEFLTAVKYGMNITHLLLNNNELGKIAKEQKGENYEVWNTSLNNLNFAAYAQSCGALGFKVEYIDDLEPALEKAIKHSGPSLVEVAVDASLP